jgi:CubicO group peptidase (beta-lactamase class C family)
MSTSDLEAEMQAILDAQGVKLGVLIERDSDGRRTRLAHGPEWADPLRKGTESSASKAVQTCAALWHIAQTPGLSLTTRLADIVPEWAAQAVGPQLDTRLWHCLTMSSPIVSDPLPAVTATPDWPTFRAGVLSLLSLPANQTAEPGSHHTYQSSHLDVGTLAIVEATGAPDWRTLFDAWRAETGFFPSFAPEASPSSTTFSLSGGVQCTLDDYLDWLTTIRDGGVLPPELRWQWLTDWLPGVAAPERVAQLCAQASVPVEDWRYTMGVWRECRTPEPEPLTRRFSTVGLGGQYNALDLDHGYRVCISRWPSGTATALSGVQLARTLEPLLEAWAALGDEP